MSILLEFGLLIIYENTRCFLTFFCMYGTPVVRITSRTDFKEGSCCVVLLINNTYIRCVYILDICKLLGFLYLVIYENYTMPIRYSKVLQLYS